jgi:hypothetical protein
MRLGTAALAFLPLVLFSLPATAGSLIDDNVFRLQAHGCDGGAPDRTLTAFRVKGIKGLVTALHGVLHCKEYVTDLPPPAHESLYLDKANLDYDVAILSSDEVIHSPDQGFEIATSEPKGSEPVHIPSFVENSLRVYTSPGMVDQSPMVAWKDTNGAAKNLIESRKGSPNSASPFIALHDLEIAPGASGAPVLNADGKLLGIVDGGLEVAVKLAAPAGILRSHMRPTTDADVATSLTKVVAKNLYLFSISTGASRSTITASLTTEGIAIVDATSLIDMTKQGREDIVTLILKYGVGVDAHTATSKTALYEAAARGLSPVVRTLIRYGADRRFGEPADSVIQAAVQSGSLDVVKALLGYDSTLYLEKDQDLTWEALATSVGRNDARLVRGLVEADASVATMINAAGDTVLHVAARAGAVDVVKEMARNLTTLPTNRSGQTPFSISVEQDDVQTFLVLVPLVNQRELNGCSVAGYAVAKNAPKIVATVVTASNVNEKACGDATLLEVAISHRASGAITALLQMDPLIRNPYIGSVPTPVPHAFELVDQRNTDRLKSLLLAHAPSAQIEFLWRGIAAVDRNPQDGLLSAAAYALNVDTVEKILASGPFNPPSTRCESGLFPLQAAFKGFMDRGRHGENLDVAASITSVEKIVDALLQNDNHWTQAGGISCKDNGNPLQGAVSDHRLLEFAKPKLKGYDEGVLVASLLVHNDASTEYLLTQPESPLFVCHEAQPLGLILPDFLKERRWSGAITPIETATIENNLPFLLKLLELSKQDKDRLGSECGRNRQHLFHLLSVAKCYGAEDVWRILWPQFIGRPGTLPGDEERAFIYEPAETVGCIYHRTLMSQNGVELAVEYLNSLGQLVTQKQGADRDYYDRLVRQSCDVVVRNITREIVDDLAKPLSSLCHRHVPG